MTILALDLGTTTGYAISHDSGRIESGIVSFKQNRFDGGGMRYLKFRKWLTEIKQCGIDEVYYESVRRHIGTDAAHCYGGFLATLQTWCEHHQIPYSGVSVGTIKKSACGRGNATKEDMIKAAIDKGFEPVDDNEADAIHILLYGLDC